ncbi:pseudouridine synthase [Candidatus Parcubacteria bacterium]|nr:MAG: pseudouridine synthase [Candidatus Parcubacteria bacterium]
MKVVLQKFIADSGYCSRRKAEDLIRAKRVNVNKKKAELGMKVSDEDLVEIAGKKVERNKEDVYIALNKPKGYTCSNRKFRGEKNIFDLVKNDNRLFVVGRLDRDSQGLVLLTNDGELAQSISHPSYESEKKYFVETDKLQERPEDIIKKLKKGVDIKDGDGIVWVKAIRHIAGSNFEIVLIEGKKRQIRRMFLALGIKVLKLKRISIGRLKLGNLREGSWEYINKSKI